MRGDVRRTRTRKRHGCRECVWRVAIASPPCLCNAISCGVQTLVCIPVSVSPRVLLWTNRSSAVVARMVVGLVLLAGRADAAIIRRRLRGARIRRLCRAVSSGAVLRQESIYASDPFMPYLLRGPRSFHSTGDSKGPHYHAWQPWGYQPFIKGLKEHFPLR